MKTCIYEHFYSKDGNGFRTTGVLKFRTISTDEAYLIIRNWNRRGGMKNKSNTFYRYDIVSIAKSTLEEMDDLSLKTGGDC